MVRLVTVAVFVVAAVKSLTTCQTMHCATPFLLAVTLVHLSGLLVAAESCPILATPLGDRVVLTYKGMPVAVGLAHVQVPAAQQTAARELLVSLLAKQRADLIWLAEFGTDDSGVARVQLVVGSTNVNEQLVARGLATYQPVKPDSAVEGPLKRAQEKAKKAGAGLWKGAAAAPPVAATAVARGPFCSELDNGYYFAAGSREVANVSSQRLIYYPDEATALKAGKKKQIIVAATKRGTTEADAEAAFESGKATYTQAVDAGNTTARDELYEKAYVDLTQSMQIYSTLVDASPDDEKLGEKLRVCMQLRYGSVKMRRFAH